MTSIYEAEIHYKYDENENQLTSRVFGALAMLPEDTVLFPFLEWLAKDTILCQDKADLLLARMTSLQSQGVTPANISLWEYTEGNYPDVCIQIADIVVVIEVKKDTPPTSKQIIEQYSNAISKLGKEKRKNEFTYFLLTNHDKIPDAVNEAQDALRNELGFPNATIHWRRWPQVWKWLSFIKEQQGLDDTARNLLDATIRLLEEVENMAYPTQFQKGWFSDSVSGNLEKVRKLCREVVRAIKEVNTKLQDYNLQTVGDQPYPKTLTRKLDDIDNWVPDIFSFIYKGAGWPEVKKPYQDPSLYIEFNLKKGEEGVYVGFCWEDLDEKQAESIKKHLDNNNQVVFDQNYWNDKKKINIYYEVSLDDLVGRDRIVGTLLGKLNCMRKLIESIEELKNDFGLKPIRKQTKRKK